MYPGILLSTAYLPPIQYMSKFLLDKPVAIEKHEHYQKQSYRNRCCIYGANGQQSLVIPVKKIHGAKTPITAVEIDHTTNWQKIHLKSIESAYRLSAFYEYYADDFREAYLMDIPMLFDWNMYMLGMIIDMLDISEKSEVTGAWEADIQEGNDWRQSINPKKRLKKPDPQFRNIAYQQVFSERFGFLPNLSIIDLLFNEGALAGQILKDSLL
jgi:hypothetical protein